MISALQREAEATTSASRFSANRPLENRDA
jgi:hypothetical protein